MYYGNNALFCLDTWLIPYMVLVPDRHEHHGPTVAVIECPNFQLMKSSIGALDDFPCVSIPSNARDSNYQVVYLDLIDLHSSHAFSIFIKHLIQNILLLRTGSWVATSGSKNWNATLCCITSVVEGENFPLKICPCINFVSIPTMFFC